MGIRIQDMLDNEFTDSCIGREKELAFLRERLEPSSDWKLFHIHGPGGIGKSTMLRLLAREIGRERCLFFDGHSGYRQPLDWLRALSASLARMGAIGEADDSAAPPDTDFLAERLNEAAASAGPIVLLLDTFEQWGPIEDWLRTDFFPLLNPGVRVCSAGRYPLEGAWERNGWRRFIQNVKLPPLSATEIDAYIRSNGITDPVVREKLRIFTGGIPLALSVAVEIVSRKKNPEFLEASEHDRAIGYLVEELLSDLRPPAFHRYLEVASVLWRFDQEWLQLLLGEPVPADSFRDFCRLPFVVSYGNAWGLHDSIRNWTRAEFQRRKPQALETCRAQAMEELRRREESDPAAKSFYALDKLYLHDNDLVRYYCFSGDTDGLVFQSVKEEELDRVEEIYLDSARHKGVGISLQSLIRPLWRAEPSGFVGIWKDGKMGGFYTFLPLNEDTAAILQKHPAAAPYLEGSPRAAKEYAIVLYGVDPSEEGMEGSASRHMAYQFNRANLVFDLSPYKEWHPVLLSIGFESIPWADSVTTDGQEYKAFLLDLRTEDFAAKIDRIFAGTRAGGPTPRASLDPETRISRVKTLLQNYSQLGAKPELIASIGPYLDGFSRSRQPAERVRLMKERIKIALARLEEGSPADVRCAKIIRMAYIKKIGSHELVAERLNMPAATYYRLLKKSVALLADLLLEEHE